MSFTRFAFTTISLFAILSGPATGWALPVSADAGRRTVTQSYPNGQVHYEAQVDDDGFRHGWTREFREDGTLMSEYMYDHGVKEGIARFYYKTGELMTVWVYRDGKRHGQSIGYYKDGSIKDKGFYKRDKLDGPVVMYYPDGTVKARLHFKDNRRDGESRTFYEDGQVHFVYRHQRGQLVYSERYSRDGQLLQKQYYPGPPPQPR